MRALTLWRPWPWAIFHGGPWAKRIENRPWKPWPSIIGQRIALHAGKRFDTEAIDDILDKTAFGERWKVLPEKASEEGLIGLVTVRGFAESPEEAAIGAGQGQERWFSGPFAWLLDDVVTFQTPIPCKGMQGLWTLSDALEQAVRRSPVISPEIVLDDWRGDF